MARIDRFLLDGARQSTRRPGAAPSGR